MNLMSGFKVVNSAPYIGSALCGCWLSDPLNNFFGRRGTIFITAIILIVTPIGSAFTHSWGALFAVRFVLGIGMGAKGIEYIDLQIFEHCMTSI